jgi:hypothetical protein
MVMVEGVGGGYAPDLDRIGYALEGCLRREMYVVNVCFIADTRTRSLWHSRPPDCNQLWYY